MKIFSCRILGHVKILLDRPILHTYRSAPFQPGHEAKRHCSFDGRPPGERQSTYDDGCQFMRKIIEGKRYDTDTATHVANYNNRHNPGDLQWTNEDLNQTAK